MYSARAEAKKLGINPEIKPHEGIRFDFDKDLLFWLDNIFLNYNYKKLYSHLHLPLNIHSKAWSCYQRKYGSNDTSHHFIIVWCCYDNLAQPNNWNYSDSYIPDHSSNT